MFFLGLAGRPQGSASGLRITSVGSLKRSSPGLTGGVNLPSSITVSRVEPEISIVEDPSPNSHRARAPPPLLRGGMGRRIGNPLQRSPHGQLLQQALLMQKHQLQQQQAQMMHRPMRGMITSAGFSAMKRPMAGSPGLPSKHPRLMPRPGASDSDAGARGGARCRICAQMSPFTQLIKEDPDIVETLKLLLGLDLEDDEDPSYPDAICKRCIGQLANFLQFKKAYEAGQLKLKEIAISKKRPASPSNIAKTSTKIVSEAELQPDLDCEVDEGESVHPVPASKSSSSSSEKQKKSEPEEDSDDERPDPMMFLQLSQVESSYSGFDEDGEEETNGEAKEEDDTDWNIDAELENENSVGNGHDEDEDLDGGVEEIGDDDEGVEEVGDDDQDEEDLGEGVDAELENLEESLDLESGDETGDFLDDATNPELDNDAENLEDEEDA